MHVPLIAQEVDTIVPGYPKTQQDVSVGRVKKEIQPMMLAEDAPAHIKAKHLNWAKDGIFATHQSLRTSFRLFELAHQSF